MDQNFQKCVSDTSTGQKQHLFMHTSCKNQVLVPSGTPQLMLKSGPYQKIPRFIRKFKEILDLWEMNQKCKNFISNTCMGQKQSFFTHISCKIQFLRWVGPFQLSLKIAIFFNFDRENTNPTKITTKMPKLLLLTFHDGFCFHITL